MANMRAPDSRHGISMATGSEPIEQLGADRSALMAAVCRIDGSLAPRHNEHDPRPHHPRLIEPVHDPRIGTVERVPVKIERKLWNKPPGLQPPIPMGVEIALLLSARRGTARPGWGGDGARGVR